ncbi:MAG: type II toxin-antitoxin system RelE/ParE family toxin [Chitinophagales bacterium]|nr:type II toxin-antitoxin system RelE/ParE family toxin [Chitinophagales bacterium]
MAKRIIIWTKTADIQYVGILEYWLKRNKSNTYPKKLIQLVANRTKLIAEKPFLYKSVNYNELRVTSLGSYSIYYKVYNDKIIITAFWDNRQDPKKLLKILTKNK